MTHSEGQAQRLAEGITRLPNRHGRDFIEIEHPLVSARISLEGAHIVRCIPTGQKPLLWLSPQEPELPGIALRGGIPLCWPWFGNQRSGPAHGIARTALWELQEVVVQESGVHITLQLPMTAMPHQLPDEQWKVRVRFELAKELTVALITTNSGKAEQALSQALHTYLPVSDITSCQINGLDGIEYLDQLTALDEVQQGPVCVDEEMDRIYHGAIGTVEVCDADERIEVTGSGSRSTVVWNPWQAKSRRLSHFPAEGYQQMLCIETANAGADTRILQPGETHTLSARIRRRV
ncbi:D-hexose-6-phosphate mutarotase [Halopseudomonas sp.]|uniref:D-hexose-6-phosphate mutarotase n=1 Tax=Halopseudomonas sp. TaxID=2901191 RepID=UPI0035639A7F